MGRGMCSSSIQWFKTSSVIVYSFPMGSMLLTMLHRSPTRKAMTTHPRSPTMRDAASSATFVDSKPPWSVESAQVSADTYWAQIYGEHTKRR